MIPLPRTHSYLLLLLGTLLFLSNTQSLHAQEKGNSFTCVTWDTLDYPEIFYRKGKEFIPLELKKGRRSEQYPLDPKGGFQLYIPKESPDGKSEMELIGQSSYAASTKRTLFLIAKVKPGSELPLAIKGIEDSLATFPPGSFRCANFTREPFLISLGDVSKVLKPKDIEVYKAKMGPKGGLLSLLVKNKQGETIFGRRLFGQPRDRSFVFITPSQTCKSGIKAWILPEIIPVKQVKKP